MQNTNNSQTQFTIDLPVVASPCDDINLQLIPTNGVDQENVQNTYSDLAINQSNSYHDLQQNLSSISNQSNFSVERIRPTIHFQQLQQIMERFWEQNNQSMSMIHVFLANLTNKVKESEEKKTSFKLSKIRVRNCECSICYQKIKKSSKIPNLPCKHKFHKKCLTKWVTQKANCPLCRNHIE